MESIGYMSCELKLDTQTPGWHKTMTKVLKSIKEVSYSVDTQAGIAYISGNINPDSLLKLLAKSGKHAELIRVTSGKHHHHHRHQYASAGGNGYGNYHDMHDQYSYGIGYHHNLYGSTPSMEHYLPPQSHHHHHQSYYCPPAPPINGFPQPPPPLQISPFYNPDSECSIM